MTLLSVKCSWIKSCDRQTDRQDRHTDRQTDRQTDSVLCYAALEVNYGEKGSVPSDGEKAAGFEGCILRSG